MSTTLIGKSKLDYIGKVNKIHVSLASQIGNKDIAMNF